MARSAAAESKLCWRADSSETAISRQLASSAGLAPRDVVKLGHCFDGSEAWSTSHVVLDLGSSSDSVG